MHGGIHRNGTPAGFSIACQGSPPHPRMTGHGEVNDCHQPSEAVCPAPPRELLISILRAICSGHPGTGGPKSPCHTRTLGR